MRVGLFDSGIGGINVLNELVRKYPNNHYIYFGDTKNLPYGNKSVLKLINLSSRIIDFLINKKVDIIIIACGTVSSNCYLKLKESYNIPIYDIISPTINYLKNSNYNNIGVIGTNKTIESNVFMIPNKNVLMKSTPSLVPMIENNLYKDNLEIRDILDDFKNIECLVLGCTHYPLLKNEISKYLDIPLIDMGVCLSNQLDLKDNDELKIDLYFSSINNELKNNVKNILKKKYSLYEHIE